MKAVPICFIRFNESISGAGRSPFSLQCSPVRRFAMARVKRGVTSHAKHKKTLKAAKGFYGRRKNTIRAAKAAVDRSMQYATRDRKVRKRVFRSLWIQRLNAAVRECGLTYSRFIDGLTRSGSELDGKVLSALAIHEPEAFKVIVEKAKSALPAAAAPATA